MKVVSWNCRGLGGSIKVEALKNLLKSEKPDILLIQETKMPEEEVMNRSSLFWKKTPKELQVELQVFVDQINSILDQQKKTLIGF